ncbi:hypothetical protein Tco_1283656 [Tanacetum coccineum]
MDRERCRKVDIDIFLGCPRLLPLLLVILKFVMAVWDIMVTVYEQPWTWLSISRSSVRRSGDGLNSTLCQILLSCSLCCCLEIGFKLGQLALEMPMKLDTNLLD